MLSPEAFVEKGVYDDPDVVPNSFHCLGIRQWERGAIVIYHVTSEQHPPGPLAGQLLRMFMCQIIERDPHLPDGWHPVGAVDSMTRAILPRQGTCSTMHTELAARGLLLLGTANED